MTGATYHWTLQQFFSELCDNLLLNLVTTYHWTLWQLNHCTLWQLKFELSDNLPLNLVTTYHWILWQLTIELCDNLPLNFVVVSLGGGEVEVLWMAWSRMVVEGTSPSCWPWLNSCTSPPNPSFTSSIAAGVDHINHDMPTSLSLNIIHIFE